MPLISKSISHTLVMSLLLLVPRAFPQSASSAKGQTVDDDPKVLQQQRIASNRGTLREIKLVDSVGWIKVNAIKRPDKSMDDLERERQQRKIAALIGFCDETRFSSLADVDSIPEMSADERAFCKERLKNVNPIIQ